MRAEAKFRGKITRTCVFPGKSSWLQSNFIKTARPWGKPSQRPDFCELESIVDSFAQKTVNAQKLWLIARPIFIFGANKWIDPREKWVPGFSFNLRRLNNLTRLTWSVFFCIQPFWWMISIPMTQTPPFTQTVDGEGQYRCLCKKCDGSCRGRGCYCENRKGANDVYCDYWIAESSSNCSTRCTTHRCWPVSLYPPTSRATGGCTDSAPQMLDSSCTAVLSAAAIFATFHARNHGG